MNSILSSITARRRTNELADDTGRTTSDSRSGGSSSPQAPVAARPSRRTRRLGVLAGAAFIVLLGTGCFPTGPVETWVPDFNSDGKISGNEVEFQKAIIVQQISDSIDAGRREVQNHPFLTCVRRHESDNGAYPHIGGYGAHNSRSSASGAYQFLDSTWRTASARAGHAGYGSADQAPWYVQDAVAMYVVNSGGKSAWNGTGC
ncbi:hypothetical protein BH10ACT3_BH10ACT3_20320 [soil metagenome]